MADFDLSPNDRDAAIRTVIGEAGNQGDAGMAGVANVIRNRINAGFAPSASGVVFQRGQFEPWGNPSTAAGLRGIDPNSPQYLRAAQVVDNVFGGNTPDNTNGATHFYGVKSQAALGRNAPSWASTFTPTAQIGEHAFFQDPQYQSAVGGGSRMANVSQDDQTQTPQFGSGSPLVPPQDRYRDLAAAMMQSGINQPVHGYGDAIRGFASLLGGQLYGNKYQQQQQDYNTALGQQIAGAAGDPQKTMQVAAMSGNPTLQQAALQANLSPKVTVSKIGQDKYGSDIYGLVHQSGRITNIDGTPLQTGSSVGTGSVGIGGAPSGRTDANGNLLTGEDFLKTLPPDQANMVRKMANGDVPYPTGTYAKSPMGQRLLQMTQQYDPDYSEITYHQRKDYLQNYTKGQVSKDIVALNSAAEHTSLLYPQIDKLGNSSLPIVGQPYNYVKNLPYVSTGDTANKFETDKQTAINEWKKYYAGGHGSEAETDRNLDLLSSSKSPEQLKGAVGELVKLAQGKVNALEQQRNAAMGPNYKGSPILYPNNQKALGDIQAAEEARASGKTAAPVNNPNAPNPFAPPSAAGTPQNAPAAPAPAPVPSHPERPTLKQDEILRQAAAQVRQDPSTLDRVNERLRAWGINKQIMKPAKASANTPPEMPPIL